MEELLVALGAFSIVAVAILVITIVGYWKVYVKMGEPGWKCIIPIYNSYTLFSRCWEVKYFAIWFVCMIVNRCLAMITEPNTIITMAAGLVGLAFFILTVMLNNQTSKAFGQGIGFTIGLTLLPTIFVLILGFGSAKYLGNPSEGLDYNSNDDYNDYNNQY